MFRGTRQEGDDRCGREPGAPTGPEAEGAPRFHQAGSTAVAPEMIGSKHVEIADAGSQRVECHLSLSG